MKLQRALLVFVLVCWALCACLLLCGAARDQTGAGKKSQALAAGTSKSKQQQNKQAELANPKGKKRKPVKYDLEEDSDEDGNNADNHDDHDDNLDHTNYESSNKRNDSNEDEKDKSENERSAERRLADWLREQKQSKSDVIEQVSGDMLELLANNMDHLVAFFYDPTQCATSSGKSSSGNKCKKILNELENIDDDTDDHGIQFVKCDDVAYAKSIGISSLPALVYFERHSSAPSIYVGDLEEEELVLEWLVKQKNEDTIENINRDILSNLIARQQQRHSHKSGDKGRKTGQKESDYLAVLFYKHQHPASEQVLELLESIDDDLSEYDVHLVKLADDLIAKKYGIRHPPGLVLFRHGEPLKYPDELAGDADVHDDLLQWLTKPENLETKNSIESVNEKMFQRFLKESHHLAVLFHSEQQAHCKQCARVMEELETIDDDLADLGVRFIKVDSLNLAKKYGIHALPGLVFIGKPETEGAKSKGAATTSTIYAGDLKRGEEILRWIGEQKSPHSNEIPELNAKQVRELIKRRDHLTVYVYEESEHDDEDDEHDERDQRRMDEKGSSKKSTTGTKSKRRVANEEDEDEDEDEEDDDQDDTSEDILTGLENIDTECRKHAIEFVKTSDRAFAAEYGLLDDDDDLPALLYFEHGKPSIYDGDLSAEEDLLDWLLQQKREDTIEEVNRKLLEKLIESSHYLVVLFQKNHCKTCQTALETLERIDDDCDAYGINMVKINDLALAKRYGIKTFPAIVYFRNGNPLIYSGDLKDEHEILDWLLDDEQRELNDEIEDINGRMLDKLIESSPFLAVLFYDEDCGSLCEKVLHELEKIDDDTDLYGIDFVKINDFKAARKHNVHTFPTLVYFRKQAPSYYDGSLLDEENVLSWLTSNDVFELEDEIEEVNKKMLDKLLETSDYIAVYFYEKNCRKCDDVLKELEHIDDEADSLNIMFVKIRDMQYAKKFGITQAPSLVYFRKKFPSIYRGDLMKEEKVLEWLRKNRYRNPELNLFMYALFTITISFILYTIFLLFCVKKTKQD